MKIYCSDCGKVGYGSRDDLIKKGWHHTSGSLNGMKFVASWCNEHFSPGKVLELLKVLS